MNKAAAAARLVLLLVGSAAAGAPALAEERVAGESAVTLAFPPAQASLDQDDKAKLQQFVQSIKDDETVAQVAVVAWSDKPLPAKQGAQLAKSDVQLAAERGRIVQTALTSMGVRSPYVYNMAQRPGAAADILHTDNATLKDQNVPKGSKQLALQAIGKQLMASGKPATAVVVAVRVPPRGEVVTPPASAPGQPQKPAK